MTQSQFLNRVIELLGLNSFMSLIFLLFIKLYPGDAVKYLRCTEEISPDLPEEIALDRMQEVRNIHHNGHRCSLGRRKTNL
jgi:hypothetical protein